MRFCPGATIRFVAVFGRSSLLQNLPTAAQTKPAAAAADAPGERVSADLDDSYDAGDFEKARVSIDWMDTCLENFTKNCKRGFCSRNKSYFCAVYPQSDGCLQGR